MGKKFYAVEFEFLFVECQLGTFLYFKVKAVFFFAFYFYGNDLVIGYFGRLDYFYG